jgi:hypothetical protein
LGVDFEGAKPSTKILGADGSLSALTLDDLEKEFIGNKAFGGVITASDASGSGTPPGSQGNGGAANQDNGLSMEQELAAQFNE